MKLLNTKIFLNFATFHTPYGGQRALRLCTVDESHIALYFNVSRTGVCTHKVDHVYTCPYCFQRTRFCFFLMMLVCYFRNFSYYSLHEHFCQNNIFLTLL